MSPHLWSIIYVDLGQDLDRHPDPQKLVNQSLKILDGNSYIKRFKVVIKGDIVVLRDWKGKTNLRGGYKRS
jgi:hypothetical protein